ncbi:MAG: hypothetical protein NC087_01645 [Anaeroplasma bactoclasticum]|nr:hypothetical protein [Anaeroplasma bactoclasticum]
MAWFGVKKGKQVCLLNPNEKGKKYSTELKSNTKQTNAGTIKKDSTGKPLKLTEKERMFRVGYLNARKDNANAFKAKQKKQNK